MDSQSVASSKGVQLRLKRARTEAAETTSSTISALQRAAISELVDHLQEHPWKSEPVLRFAKMAKLPEKEETDAGEGSFHDTYRKLYRVPKEFLRSWLPTLASSPLAFSSESLSRLEKCQDGALRSIFYLVTGTSADTAWPKFCHSRAVFKSTFARAARELGNRIDQIRVEQHGDRFSVDFSRCGCYTLEPLEGEKSHIKFISGAKVALSDFAVPNDEYQIVDNTNPLKAYIKLKRATCRCIELFGEQEQNAIKEECSSRGSLFPISRASIYLGGGGWGVGGIAGSGCEIQQFPRSASSEPAVSLKSSWKVLSLCKKKVLNFGGHDSLDAGEWLQRIANEEQQALEWPEAHHSQTRYDAWAWQQWQDDAGSQVGGSGEAARLNDGSSHAGTSSCESTLSFARAEAQSAPASAAASVAEPAAQAGQQQQQQEHAAASDAAPPTAPPASMAVAVKKKS